MAEPPTVAEFRKMPFKVKSFVKYGIQSYWPQNGLVEAERGDTLSFSITHEVGHEVLKGEVPPPWLRPLHVLRHPPQRPVPAATRP